MFTKERQDYTQMLFNHFITKSISQPYGYMCRGAVVLTTDHKLLKKLEKNDKEKLSKGYCHIQDLKDAGIELNADSKLLPNVNNAVLFSTPQTFDGLSEKSIGDEYTLILVNGEESFDRFEETIPTIIQHHIDKYCIDVDKNTRVPLLHADISRNNNKVDLKYDGNYCFSDDFKYVSESLIEKLDTLKTSNIDSNDEYSL